MLDLSSLRLIDFITSCNQIRALPTWIYHNISSQISSRLSEQDTLNEEDLLLNERFVILMYDLTSSTNDINNCRRELFTKKAKTVENIPPTRDALIQHIRRAMLQSMYVHLNFFVFH